MRPMYRHLSSIVLLLVITSSVLTFVARAEAAPAGYPSEIKATASLRYCTTVGLPGCAGRRSLSAGTFVKMNCWIDDSYATGRYRSNRWFYVTTPGKVRGFVHSSWVDPQTTVGRCTTHSGVAAARWAAMRQGEKNKTGLAMPTTRGDWSGDCYAFAWNAHAMTTGRHPISGLGTAHATYKRYLANGKVNTNLSQSVIQIGSIVFWKASSSIADGHAAIYVGNGHVASTRGLDGDNKPVEVAAMSSFGTPSGWVAPENL